MNYRLINGELSHKKNPDTFDIPEKTLRHSLKKGDFVKLGFEVLRKKRGVLGGERMWVKITKVQVDKTYLGELNNHPHSMNLRCGELVHFGPENVIAILDFE